MYAVGSDTIALAAAGTVPVGPLHAVDADGQVLCRDARARFYFPARPWMTEETPDAERSQACSPCAAVALERAMPMQAADAYPGAAAGRNVSPALSAFDWLAAEADADMTSWSVGL